MAYVLPTYNTPVNITTGGGGPLRIAGLKCNLAFGSRVNVTSTGGTSALGVPLLFMYLLLPKGTDIRGPLQTTGSDIVEAPAGSGRFYTVEFVDDVGKGFDNEHRLATLKQLSMPTPLT